MFVLVFLLVLLAIALCPHPLNSLTDIFRGDSIMTLKTIIPAAGLCAAIALTLAPTALADAPSAPDDRARYKLNTRYGPCDVDFHNNAEDLASGQAEIYCGFDQLGGRFSWDVSETSVDLHESEMPNFASFFAAENCSAGWEDIEVGETSETLCWVDWTSGNVSIERIR